MEWRSGAALAGVFAVAVVLSESAIDRLPALAEMSEGGARVVVQSREPIDPALREGIVGTLHFRVAGLATKGAHVSASATGDRTFEVFAGGVDKDRATALVHPRSARGPRPLELAWVLADHPFSSDAFDRAPLRFDSISDFRPGEVTGLVDIWTHSMSGRRFEDPYLASTDRTQLESFIGGLGDPPAGTRVALEHVVPYAGSDAPAHWRTYLVEADPLVTALDVTDAMVVFNPQTGRPEVQLGLGPNAAQRFGDATDRRAGQKLAILINGEVASAPLVQSAIPGGRLVITMGGSDPTDTQREAEALVEHLRSSALPPGVEVTSAEDIPARPWIPWLLRILFGALAAALAWWLGRITEPVTTARLAAVPNQRTPWFAIALSVLAPFASLAAIYFPLPGIVPDALASYVVSSGEQTAVHDILSRVSIFALGLTPVLSAAILVEIVAVLVPRWRRRRISGPTARRPLAVATAVLALVLALVQGLFVATWLESFGRFGGSSFSGGEIVPNPGWAFRITIAVTCAGGTWILLLLAAAVQRRGLVSGFAILLLSPLAFMVFEDAAFVFTSGFEDGRALATPYLYMIPAGLAIAWLSGRRVGRLHLPSSGLCPLEWVLIGPLLATLAVAVPGSIELSKWFNEAARASSGLGFLVVAVAFFTAIWTAAFARGESARKADLVRAGGVTALVLAALICLVTASRGAISIGTLALAGLLATVVRDAAVEIRARRRRSDWVLVWSEQRVHRAGGALRALADADIPCFGRALHTRALYFFFAPFIPIGIHVAEERKAEAREIILTELRPVQDNLPAARAA